MRKWWSEGTAAAVATVLGAASAAGQTSGRPDGLRFIPPTAEHAIRMTMEAPDALGFHMDGTPDPTRCKHYQGMVRVDGADGTPFFIVSRQRQHPGPASEAEQGCAGDTDNGAIIVVRMLSRPKHRERLRSNRLSPQTLIRETVPPANDRALSFFTVVGGDPLHADPAQRPGLIRGHVDGMPERIYQHPGGMALVGNILAVAMEHPRQSGTIPPTQIMFFDVTDPEAPVFKSQYTPVDSLGYPRHSAGVVAVTPLPSGRYLMLVAGGRNEKWLFYRSTLTDLASPNLSWEYIGLLVGPNGIDDPHQTLTFLRQGSITGQLYLAGARGHALLGDRDRIDLYRIACDNAPCNPGEPILRGTIWSGRRIVTVPAAGGIDRLANLAAASAFHLTPSGELLFYATTHDNDGPDGTVEMGEWRHLEVVRDGSPTILPSLTIDGPVTVNEGSSVGLSGRAQLAITRPFIQLFTGLDFTGAVGHRRPRRHHQGRTGTRWRPSPGRGTWFGPPGCEITTFDGQGRTRTLAGTGRVERAPDLSLVINDAGTANMDRKVVEVRFDQDCRQFYTQRAPAAVGPRRQRPVRHDRHLRHVHHRHHRRPGGGADHGRGERRHEPDASPLHVRDRAEREPRARPLPHLGQHRRGGERHGALRHGRPADHRHLDHPGSRPPRSPDRDAVMG